MTLDTPGRRDNTAAVGVMRGCPETLHLKQSDIQTIYLIVEPDTDPTAPGALSFTGACLQRLP